MPAEAPDPAPAFTDVDRAELARRLCRGLYQLWLREQGATARPAPVPRRRHAPGDGAGDLPRQRSA